MADCPAFIGKFRVVRLLGEGGMGSVYLAQDPRVKPARAVAIKMMKEDNAELRERFVREAGIVAGFAHPNIVPVFEVDEQDGYPFMAMAYVQGETLAEMIRRRAPLPFVRKLEIIEDLCSGLSYAHRHGVIHRDVKPANVMIDSEETLKILDFGIARLGDSTLTRTNTLMGSPNYMSPEQLTGRPLDPRSDLFAVGAVAYELLTYRKAFPGGLPEVLHKILHLEPEPLRAHEPPIDPAVVDIIERALSKDPSKRYPDLSVMQREVARVRRRIEATMEEPTTADAGVHLARIEALLIGARQAFAGGDLDAARGRVAEALAVDSGNAEAVALDQAIQAQEIDRQNREWLLEAQRSLGSGDFTRAGELVEQILRQAPASSEAAELRAEISRRRKVRDDELAQQRAVGRALTRARTQIAERAFESGIRALDDVFAIAPQHPEALQLAAKAREAIDERDRRGLAQQAQQAIAEARTQFDRGDRQEAIDQLRAFSPLHPAVTEAVRLWTDELQQIEQELEGARRHQIADCLGAGLKAAAAGRLDEAASDLAEIERLDPDGVAAGQLSRAIEEQRQSTMRLQRVETLPAPANAARDDGTVNLADEAERRRHVEATEHMARAEQALAAGDLDAAPAEVDAIVDGLTVGITAQLAARAWNDAGALVDRLAVMDGGHAAIATARERIRAGLGAEEAERQERAALRSFYGADYEKALETFDRIPLTMTSPTAHDRILFYMACSHAALALLEGPLGNSRLQKARDLFRQSQRHQTPFTVDRDYISPRIIGVLEGSPTST